jgi:hypothetical protein
MASRRHVKVVGAGVAAVVAVVIVVNAQRKMVPTASSLTQS